MHVPGNSRGPHETLEDLGSSKKIEILKSSNSIPGMKSRFHNKDKVAEGIRTFLNKYGEENMRNWRRCFNKNSFPVYELKGKIFFFRFPMST